LRARQKLKAKEFDAARADFLAAKTIPDNLPDDREDNGGHNPEISYWLGRSYEAMGNLNRAQQCWQEAASPEPASASCRQTGREDPLSEQTAQHYYQGLAEQKLGRAAEAAALFRNLMNTATEFVQPSDDGASKRANAALPHYISGLGRLGLGDKIQAAREFTLALQACPDHLGSKIALAEMQNK
jgi:tetratricopeptide (TPR) repeat protein